MGEHNAGSDLSPKRFRPSFLPRGPQNSRWTSAWEVPSRSSSKFPSTHNSDRLRSDADTVPISNFTDQNPAFNGRRQYGEPRNNFAASDASLRENWARKRERNFVRPPGFENPSTVRTDGAAGDEQDTRSNERPLLNGRSKPWVSTKPGSKTLFEASLDSDLKSSSRSNPFSCNVLHMSYFPIEFSEAEIREHFQNEPGFSSVFYRTNYSFIHFIDTETATSAKEKLDGKRLKNFPRCMKISFSRSWADSKSIPHPVEVHTDAMSENICTGVSEQFNEEAKAALDSVSSQTSLQKVHRPTLHERPVKTLVPDPSLNTQFPENLNAIPHKNDRSSKDHSRLEHKHGDRLAAKAQISTQRLSSITVRPSNSNSPRVSSYSQNNPVPNQQVTSQRTKDYFRHANTEMKAAKAEHMKDPGPQPWDSDSGDMFPVEASGEGFENPRLWFNGDGNNLVDWDGNLAPTPLDSERGSRMYNDPSYIAQAVLEWRKVSDMSPHNIEISNDNLMQVRGEIALPQWDPPALIEEQPIHEWWQNLQHVALEECGVYLLPFWRNRVAPNSSELNAVKVMEVHVDPEGLHGSELVATQDKINKYRRKAAKLNVSYGTMAPGATASGRHTKNRAQRVSTPFANVYIRPAEEKDMQQITNIWNSYIQSTVFCPERDPLPDRVVRQRWEDVRRASLPWLVAVARSRRNKRANRLRKDNQNTETIAGFAFADDYNDARGMYRYTVELETYISESFLRQGVGRSLMDRLVCVLDPTYRLCGGYDFVYEGSGYSPGGDRTIGNIIINVAYASDDESRIKWITEWLAKWEFSLNGQLLEVGFKLSSKVSLAILSRKTGVRLEGDAA